MANSYHTDGQGTPDSISADIEAALASVAFPANKDSLVEAARASGASNEVITVLTGLPEQDYRDASAVLRQFG
jgi:hypothetical protein